MGKTYPKVVRQVLGKFDPQLPQPKKAEELVTGRAEKNLH
jgi:hypothetical protein